MEIFEGLNKNLEGWCDKHGFQGISVEADFDFCYIPKNQMICYSFLSTEESEKTDMDFLQFFHEYGGIDGIGCSVLSFLHEIGHFMTLDLFSEDEKENTRVYKKNVLPSIEDRHERNYAYWLNEIEFAANVWAISFAKENYEAVSELGEIFRFGFIDIWDNHYEELSLIISDLNESEEG